MKVKDLEKTANVAWSPRGYKSILLAAGTAAQQLDASFNTNAALEIHSLNLGEPGPDLKQECSFPSDQRFHKIIWSSYGNNQDAGTIIGGCDGGIIKIYDAFKLLNGENGLVSQQVKHVGPVHALDYNPFQCNLFATGAGESEIFIWDMNNLQTPMTPGVKSQPLEDVMSLAWNRQVQHILASTFSSKCVIWDLRKNEPIIKLADTVSRVRWKTVAWHPEVATQMCLASEEDHSPVIQIWDLRFATSPLKTLENHQRGILSLAWCSDDPDLLISCGKDNRILCWNPSSNEANGEILSEVAKTNQWSFDVVWCPKNPAIIACPSFDGHVSIYSLMGGKVQQVQTSNKIADSFPGVDSYMEAPFTQNTGPISVDLSKPPKWLKRPVGVRFSLGGKLITFGDESVGSSQANNSTQNGNVNAILKRNVNIFQVVTEPELTQKSQELEQTLQEGNFVEFCKNKADNTNDQYKKYLWHFIKANFEANPRAELLNLLGFNVDDVNKKLEEVIGENAKKNISQICNDFSDLNRIDDFELIQNAQPPKKPVKRFKILTGNDNDGLITQALLLGNVKYAVELCLKAKKFADAIIIAMKGGQELLLETQRKYLEENDGYVSSVISALVTDDWASIINNCEIDSWKEALAATLTHATDEDLPHLCDELGCRLENECQDNKKLLENAHLCYICSGNIDKFVKFWNEKASKSTADLQELVEIVTFLQKIIERQDRRMRITEPVADVLCKYAMILTCQGELPTALTYLSYTNNEKISSLKERLIVHLGQRQTYSQPVRRQSSQTPLSAFSSSNMFNAPPPNPVIGSTGVPPTNTLGSQAMPFGSNQTFNTNFPSAPPAISRTWQNPNTVPRSFSPSPTVPPPTIPNKSTNYNSNPNGGPATLSRKYVLDPSLTTNQYGNFPRNQTMGGYPNPQYGFVNPLGPTTLSNPSPASTPALNPLPPSDSGFNADFRGSTSLGQPPIAQEATEPNLVNFMPQAPGWNDPPVFNKPARNPKVENSQPLEPITHPLFGVAPLQSQMPQMDNGYGDANLQPSNQFANPYDPPKPMCPPPLTAELGAPRTSFNPETFNQNAITPSVVGQLPTQMAAQQRREPPAVVPKVPIPEEHIHMKTVFDELKVQCSCAANNPQIKRKLDDVGRKLEILYDMLREKKLSQNALASLHQMVQMVQNGNYQGGLNLHTQMVSGSDFVQIANFMPGLKVLLQCALQMQVYLR